jgi:hypothetical protein
MGSPHGVCRRTSQQTEASTLLTVAKTWKCRLRLHDWDDRENPETHEHYEVCLRCNAYRERGRAYPGAGAAGVTGTGGG